MMMKHFMHHPFIFCLEDLGEMEISLFYRKNIVQ